MPSYNVIRFFIVENYDCTNQIIFFREAYRRLKRDNKLPLTSETYFMFGHEQKLVYGSSTEIESII